jgi:hypothetical protein
MRGKREMQVAEGAHHCELPCRWCDGSTNWTPEKPHISESGEIVFIRVDEQCRMCMGTGECMHVHAGDRTGTPGGPGV